jgi:OFA family oxalate/formate antiporter-like MFS transporter
MSQEKRGDRVKAILGCCGAIFWSGAIAFGYPGVMTTCWQELFSVGADATGLVVTFMLVGLSIGLFFSGRTYMKWGIRCCIGIGTVLELSAFLILLRAKTIYIVYVWAVLVNFGASFIYGPGLTTVQRWLPSKKGLASGLINLIFGISAAIMSPIWNQVLASRGYQAVNLSLIVCILVTNLLALLLARTPIEAAQADVEAADSSLTAAQALKTRSFWLIWLLWAFMGAAGISLVSLAKSYAILLGLSSVSILMAFNLTNGLGRLVAGILCDKLGGCQTGILGFLVAALGYFLLPHGSSVGSIGLFAACVGFGFGTLFTITGPVAAQKFGMRYFSIIFGLIFSAYGFVGGILGPLLSGAVLERTGNYLLIFTYLGVFALIAAVLLLTELLLSKREKQS